MSTSKVTRRFLQFYADGQPIPIGKFRDREWRHEARVYLAMTDETVRAWRSPVGAGRCSVWMIDRWCELPAELDFDIDGYLVWSRYRDPKCSMHRRHETYLQHMKNIERRFDAEDASAV